MLLYLRGRVSELSERLDRTARLLVLQGTKVCHIFENKVRKRIGEKILTTMYPYSTLHLHFHDSSKLFLHFSPSVSSMEIVSILCIFERGKKQVKKYNR